VSPFLEKYTRREGNDNMREVGEVSLASLIGATIGLVIGFGIVVLLCGNFFRDTGEAFLCGGIPGLVCGIIGGIIGGFRFGWRGAIIGGVIGGIIGPVTGPPLVFVDTLLWGG
jgi:hypothetical protein